MSKLVLTIVGWSLALTASLLLWLVLIWACVQVAKGLS